MDVVADSAVVLIVDVADVFDMTLVVEVRVSLESETLT